MTPLEERINAAEDRIKELKLLIEHWKKQTATPTVTTPHGEISEVVMSGALSDHYNGFC